MRKFIYIFLLFCFHLPLTVSANQAHLNLQARMFQHDLQKYLVPAAKKIELPDYLTETYALIPTENSYLAGVIAEVNPDKVDLELLQNKGVFIGTQIDEIWTLRIPVENFNAVCRVPGINYIDMSLGIMPTLDSAKVETGVDKLHEGIEALQMAYSGKDVIVAVIDWGFDYTHPNFYDSLMDRYRIKAIWDQNNITYHRPPHNYNYGTYFRLKEKILQVERDDDYIFGPFSHGTHVAGIAAGGGAGTRYKGVAPEADLVFISLRRDAPSLIDAFNFIDQLADEAGKPYVVNMSFGGHYGPHDGTDLQNRTISKLAGKGKVFVGSGGNNGNTGGFHLHRNFRENSDTLRSIISFAWENYQTISMWSDPGEQFKTRISVRNSRGDEILTQTPFLNTEDNPFQDFLFLFGSDTVEVRISGEKSSFLNDKPNKRIEVKRSRNHTVTIEVVSDSADLHMWNCQKENVRYSNRGVPFLKGLSPARTLPGFEEGDEAFGVNEPSGVGPDVITVAAHTTKRSYENILGSTHSSPAQFGETTHDLALFSSHGPTVYGKMKPDISAPGNMVISSVSSFDDRNTNRIAEEVEFNGRTYQFEGFSGTSMSGPVVTGVVALMLEANPELTHKDVHHIIQTTARTDEFTGEIPEGGSTLWGAGKLNAHAAVQMAETFEASDEDDETPESDGTTIEGFLVYPNPNYGEFNLIIQNLDTEADFIDMHVYDALGRKWFSDEIELHNNHADEQFDLRPLPNGLYILKLQFDDRRKVIKVSVNQ